MGVKGRTAGAGGRFLGAFLSSTIERGRGFAREPVTPSGVRTGAAGAAPPATVAGAGGSAGYGVGGLSSYWGGGSMPSRCFTK